MARKDRLKLLQDHAQRSLIIENSIRRLAGRNAPLEILEAGCGKRWDIDLAGIEYTLAGVDLDATALAIRRDRVRDLNEVYEGDLRSIDLGPRTFDVIYSAYVLEHVDGAEAVLMNFVRWLKPGGIVILRIPDPKSVRGFMAKVTPHWFHIAFYRYFLGFREAGRPGQLPYPTFYDPVVSREGVHRFCVRQAMSILDEYGDGLAMPRSWPQRFALQWVSAFVGLLSLGALSTRHANLLYILQRPPA